MKLLSSSLALLLALAAAPALADGPVVVLDGGRLFPGSGAAGSGGRLAAGGVWGGALAYRWDSGWTLGLDYQQAHDLALTDRASGSRLGHGSDDLASLDAAYTPSPAARFRPFVALGLGQASLRAHPLASGDHGVGNLGAGATLALTPLLSLQGELRAVRGFGPDPRTDLLLLAGLRLEFGEPAEVQEGEPAPQPVPVPAP